MADDDAIEQTLHIAREVDVFTIPPRPPTGHSSGTWLVSSKIFSGRLRVVSKGMDCEVRLEAPDSDQLFATCPVPYGMRNVCVEPAMDSSRYFVLRVEDPATKRHAFLGIGFQQRGDAFDFNEALIRHEKFAERERAASQLSASPSAAATGSGGAGVTSPPGARRTTPTQSAQATAAAAELASLYASKGDLSLKAGQTIHVSVKPGGAAGGGKASAGAAAAAGGHSWLTAAPAVPTAQAGASGLFKLAPPPADAAVKPLAPPPPSTSSWQQPNGVAAAAAAPQPQGIDLLGWDVPAPAAAAAPSRPPAVAAAPPPVVAAQQTSDWAMFD